MPLAIFHDHVYFETSVNEMGKTLATGLLMFFLITGRYTSRIFVDDHNNGNPLLMTQPVYCQILKGAKVQLFQVGNRIF